MIFKSKSKQQQPNVSWKSIDSDEDLVNIDQSSSTHPVLIFKHASKCFVSRRVLQKFEKELSSIDQVMPFFLDVIQKKELSHKIATKYQVGHQSPQLLVIKNGECINHASHSSISSKIIE